jgi:hypothetical protein
MPSLSATHSAVLELMIILLLRWVLIRENKAKERARAELAAATADEDADDLKAAGGPAANDTTFADLTCALC